MPRASKQQVFGDEPDVALLVAWGHIALAKAPAVSYLGVGNNARTMVATVSVAGLSFGQSDSTPSGRIDGVACGTAAWTSGTSVMCRELSAASSASTEVTVGGLAGTRYPAFTFDCFLSRHALYSLFVLRLCRGFQSYPAT